MADDHADLSAYDPADYLESPETIAEFLVAAAEEDDPVFIIQAMGIAARACGMV